MRHTDDSRTTNRDDLIAQDPTDAFTTERRDAPDAANRDDLVAENRDDLVAANKENLDNVGDRVPGDGPYEPVEMAGGDSSGRDLRDDESATYEGDFPEQRAGEDRRDDATAPVPAGATQEQVSPVLGTPEAVRDPERDEQNLIEEADRPEADTRAADSTAAAPTGMQPGDAGAHRSAPLWAQGADSGLRDRWQALQLRFVDDPRAVAEEARALVDEAVQGFTAALADRQHDLDRWQDDGDDTEQLRVAVQGYRELFELIVAR